MVLDTTRVVPWWTGALDSRDRGPQGQTSSTHFVCSFGGLFFKGLVCT